MPTASRRSRVVDAQPDLEGLDVALGAADVALRREAGIDAAIEHRALALLAGRQPHLQVVAERRDRCRSPRRRRGPRDRRDR